MSVVPSADVRKRESGGRRQATRSPCTTGAAWPRRTPCSTRRRPRPSARGCRSARVHAAAHATIGSADQVDADAGRCGARRELRGREWSGPSAPGGKKRVPAAGAGLWGIVGEASGAGCVRCTVCDWEAPRQVTVRSSSTGSLYVRHQQYRAGRPSSGKSRGRLASDPPFRGAGGELARIVATMRVEGSPQPDPEQALCNTYASLVIRFRSEQATRNAPVGTPPRARRQPRGRRWQRGHQLVERPPMRPPRIVVPHLRHGSPARP